MRRWLRPLFNREDMTMKMIGLSQRLPFPGKRGLRKDVAAKDAEAIGHGYQETVNRVIRDLKVAYFDLGLALERIQLVEKNKLIVEDTPPPRRRPLRGRNGKSGRCI